MEFEAENQGGLGAYWQRFKRFWLPESYQAGNFQSSFRRAYGDGGPTFVSSSYKEALVQAHREKRLALFYLHSAIHDNTDRFCSSVLLNEEVVSYFSENFVCWGGDVSTPAGYEAASTFEVGDFPYIGIFFVNTAGSVSATSSRIPLQRVFEHQGAIGAQELLTQIHDHLNRASPAVQRIFAERTAREEDIRIREEQDRRYEEAMAKDRERIERAEAEERKRQEEEQAQRAREEQEEISKRTEEALELSKKLAKEEELEQIQKEVPKEPPHGPKDSANPTTNIRFMFPNGTREHRLFLATSTVKDLFNFAALQLHEKQIDTQSSSLLDFKVTSKIPKKRTFNRETEGNLTLEEVGLYPDGVLFVSVQAN